MCSKQTFSSITVYSISHFFRSYKPYFICIIFFIKKNKIGSVACRGSFFICSIKFFCGLYSYKMFYFTNNTNLLKIYTASLFLPFARLAEITFLPFFVFILVLNPCVLFLGVLCGWYVLFIRIS